MDQQGKFDRGIEALHGAALGDLSWPETSALIDRACGWKGSHLIVADRHTRGRPEWLFDQFYYHGDSAEELGKEYIKEFYARDERFEPRRGGLSRFLALPDRRVVPVTDLIADEELKSSAVYHDLLRRAVGQRGFNVRMDGPDGLDIIMGIADPVGGGEWSSEQIETIERMLPHIRQFLRVRHALIRAEARGSTHTGLLENAAVGTIYLDKRGRILEANERARAMLRQHDGVADQDGTLRASTATDDTKLGKLLANALPGRGRQPVSGSLAIERSLLLPRLVVHVNPLEIQQLDFGARSAAALVLLVDPGIRVSIDADLVASTFRLTRAEAQVAAALAAGGTVRGIAQETFRAESSVRWLIKQVHAKLGISRQADLVRLVWSATQFSSRR